MPQTDSHEFLMSLLLGTLEKSKGTAAAMIVIVDDNGVVGSRKYIRADIAQDPRAVLNAHAACMGALQLVQKEHQAVTQGIIAQLSLQAGKILKS